MNFKLTQLPHRTEKPRENGISMVMDKGLSLRQTEDLLETSSEYFDIIKFGWTTSYFTPKLSEKIDLFQQHKIPCYFGGTLFEAFIVRNQFDQYRKLLVRFKIDLVEVSDGSIDLPHEKKCHYIKELAKDFTVFSEVGSKDVAKIIPPYLWIDQMEKELAAGSTKVIGEARESGNVGLFRGSGEVRQGLVEEIVTKISVEKIIWETPLKSQQVWFVKQFGANVNLGNISSMEVISLESIRQGLRGDTFDVFSQ